MYDIVSTNTPDIVKSFSLQVDPSRAAECAAYKETLESVFQLGLQSVNMVIAAFGNPSTVVVGKGFTESVKVSVQASSNKIQAFWGTAFEKLTPLPWTPGPGAFEATRELEKGWRKQRVINFDPYQLLYTNMNGWAQQIYQNHKHDGKAGTLSFDQGFSQSLICGAFEGDTSDRNSVNVDALDHFLADRLESLRKNSRLGFQRLYTGLIPVEGYPSLMAIIMINRDWEGPESLQSQMMDLEQLKEYVPRFLAVSN